mmetsp:Transcript_41767/g.110054  ORF Transcript_41767/g.110054 Transcript_41767/m.110054 type:complete len:543 (+) Transcript_41767:1-1629(+)
MAVGLSRPSCNPPPLSLHVRDLDDEVNEDVLRDLFNVYGPVLQARVCRDPGSQVHGYVDFQSVADAERALDALRDTGIRGKRCRIEWSHREPQLRHESHGSTVVKNADRSAGRESVKEVFGLFGNILSCEVAKDDSGSSRGYGFVHYESERSAKNAIERVNGMLEEQIKQVGPLRCERSEADPDMFSDVYLKHLPEAWQEESKLREVVSEFGEVKSLTIMEDRQKRKFAFCNFASCEAAEKAVKALHDRDTRTPEQIEEQQKASKEGGVDPERDSVGHPQYRVYCQRAHTKTERQQDMKQKSRFTIDRGFESATVFVKGFAPEVDEDQLSRMFEDFGTIRAVRVLRDDSGVSKGSGFLNFEDHADATKAVLEMHMKEVNGRPLAVGIAEKKDERAQRLMRLQNGGSDVRGGLNTPGFDAPSSLLADRAVGISAQMMGKGYGFMAAAMHGAPRPARVDPPAKAAPPPKSKPQDELALIKRALGEKLYPLVGQQLGSKESLAGKITGMILEMDNAEIQNVIDSPVQLKSKVAEARRVLEDSGKA